MALEQACFVSWRLTSSAENSLRNLNSFLKSYLPARKKNKWCLTSFKLIKTKSRNSTRISPFLDLFLTSKSCKAEKTMSQRSTLLTKAIILICKETKKNFFTCKANKKVKSFQVALCKTNQVQAKVKTAPKILAPTRKFCRHQSRILVWGSRLIAIKTIKLKVLTALLKCVIHETKRKRHQSWTTCRLCTLNTPTTLVCSPFPIFLLQESRKCSNLNFLSQLTRPHQQLQS